MPVPAASRLTFALLVWDSPGAGGHVLHLGLRVSSPTGRPAPSRSLALAVDLLPFSLPPGAPLRAGLLGETRIDVGIALPAGSAPFRADAVRCALRWRTGAALQADVSVTGVTVTVEGNDLTIGDIALPAGLTAVMADSAPPRRSGTTMSVHGPLVPGRFRNN